MLRRSQIGIWPFIVAWLDGTEDPYYGGTTGIFSGHKFSLFEGGIRVPALLSWGNRLRPRTVDSPHIAMDIQHGDRAKIHNVVFENIRVEFDDKIPTPIYQNSDDQVYDPNADPNYCPALAVIIINSTHYSHDTENGTVDGVIFKDIQVYGTRTPPVSLTGLDADHMAKDVLFENVQLGGRRITSPEGLNLSKNAFVENVQVK